jgi:hypothetical protein
MAPGIYDTNIGLRNPSPQSVIQIVKVIQCLLDGHIPEEWTTALIFSYFLKKGAGNDCDNYRSISILNYNMNANF